VRMKGLSLETIPVIHIPFRFFITAPLMGIIAAVILLCGADRVFSSPWSPELLAITHLLTLGFMAMIMLGAMFQLVPVISGQMIAGGTRVATVVHTLLCTGVVLLAAGFYWQAYSLFSWAVPLLLLAFLVFLLALASVLLRRVGGGDSIYTIRFAAASLLVSVALGLLRAANYAGLVELQLPPNTTNIHLAWGLAGWVLLLVMGASYQVIPMFHVTPNYPSALARVLPTAVFLSLASLTFISHQATQAVAVITLCSAAVIYGIFSNYLLTRRKRKVADITARFWRLALSSLVVAAALQLTFYFAGDLLPSAVLQQQLYTATGLIMIYGFAVSVIMGMLQKIVPFLSYLHLQRSCMSNFEMLKTLPHMGEIVPAAYSRWQFRLHLAALLLLLVAVFSTTLTEVAALLLLADFGWLAITLARAILLYLKTAKRIAA